MKQRLSEKGNFKAMETDRCAHLMNCAIAGNIRESWIAPQPPLLAAYVRQYLPWLALPIAEKARI